MIWPSRRRSSFGFSGSKLYSAKLSPAKSSSSGPMLARCGLCACWLASESRGMMSSSGIREAEPAVVAAGPDWLLWWKLRLGRVAAKWLSLRP